MKKLINISSLRKSILDQGLGMITVFGNGPEVNLCSDLDNGESPYMHYLGLEGDAEILNLREASPIWENLLEDIERKRPIYRITDGDNGWMEIVTYEK